MGKPRPSGLKVGDLQTPPAAGLTVTVQVVVEDIREIPGAEVVSSWKWPMLRVQTCSGIFLSTSVKQGNCKRPKLLANRVLCLFGDQSIRIVYRSLPLRLVMVYVPIRQVVRYLIV